MKKVYIVHGWDGSPKEPMLKWLKFNLEKENYSVVAIEMPDSSEPKIKAWVGKLKETIRPDSETILIGHSIGCQAILRYIETLPKALKIAGIVLIAPWMKLDMQTIKEEGEEVVEVARPWTETPIDLRKVKSHITKAVAIFSDNDLYVPSGQRALFEKELAAKTIVENKKGHFTVSDGVKELKSAFDAVKSF